MIVVALFIKRGESLFHRREQPIDNWAEEIIRKKFQLENLDSYQMQELFNHFYEWENHRCIGNLQSAQVCRRQEVHISTNSTSTCQ
jgi:hypothetical protein